MTQMRASSIERRIERLEAVREPFDPEGIANMSADQLREWMDKTLEELGGKDAALIALRAFPESDPDTIKMVEDWPWSWSLRD